VCGHVCEWLRQEERDGLHKQKRKTWISKKRENGQFKKIESEKERVHDSKMRK